MICPMMSIINPPTETPDYKQGGHDCVRNWCTWWCDGERECSIKVLALHAIKEDEK